MKKENTNWGGIVDNNLKGREDEGERGGVRGGSGEVEGRGAVHHWGGWGIPWDWKKNK